MTGKVDKSKFINKGILVSSETENWPTARYKHGKLKSNKRNLPRVILGETHTDCNIYISILK